MSLIFLVENEEQLHWMVLSTFFLLKMSLIYVALCLKQQRTLFQREGLWVCKMTRARGSTCGGRAGRLGRYRSAVLSIVTLGWRLGSREPGGEPQRAMHREVKVCYCQRCTLFGLLVIFSPTTKFRFILSLKKPWRGLIFFWLEENS